MSWGGQYPLLGTPSIIRNALSLQMPRSSKLLSYSPVVLRTVPGQCAHQVRVGPAEHLCPRQYVDEVHVVSHALQHFVFDSTPRWGTPHPASRILGPTPASSVKAKSTRLVWGEAVASWSLRGHARDEKCCHAVPACQTTLCGC